MRVVGIVQPCPSRPRGYGAGSHDEVLPWQVDRLVLRLAGAEGKSGGNQGQTPIKQDPQLAHLHRRQL